MNFRKRFYVWIVLTPTLLGFATTFVLLSRTLQFSAREWMTLVVLWWLIHSAANVWLALRATVHLDKLRQNVTPERASEALSACHQRTSAGSNVVWLGGTITFALAAFAFVLRTEAALTHIFVSSLVAAILVDIFIYGALKRLLVGEALRYDGVQYIGKEIPIARKIGVVFIGLFLAGASAIALLVTARVSATLEGVALKNGQPWFESSYSLAAVTGGLTAEKLKELDSYVPPEYELFVLRRDGTLLKLDELLTRLTRDEIAQMQRRRRGDSSAFHAPNVFSFRELADGSILGMIVPFDAFRNVPRQITIYTAVVGLITALFFTIATYYISKDISNPLRKVRSLAVAMAEGNFVEAPRIFTDDEISTLARSFAASRGNLRDLISRLGSSGSTIASGVKIISGGTSSLVNAAQEQSALTRESTRAVESVKSGAEAVLAAAEAMTGGAADTSARAVELHASAEEVARSMDHLSDSVDQISSSILEMKSSAEETSNRTDLLANIGEEVLTFVTQMSATVTELQRSANGSATIAREVRSTAAAGTDEVRQSVASTRVANEATARASAVIHELTTRIAQISQIVAVIEDIAGRTNLLSLNAAIIAAQAGDQGAGFSVVADEIRELADRTRKSTTEISGIVRAVQQGSREAVRAIEEGAARVHESVQLAERASSALGKIASIAEESNDMALRMAGSLEEQALAATHLRAAASTMSEHIHEINRSTQEQAQATGLLAAQTERVRDIALQVKNSTDQQSFAARGITVAMEDIVSDVSTVRDHLQQQLAETERILSAAMKILTIADANSSIASEFSSTVDALLHDGRAFEAEVARFRLTSG